MFFVERRFFSPPPGFDEEQRRVSAAYRSELEAHGVHLLNDEARGQIVELQTRLARLSFAFGNGDGSQLYGLLEAREELANLLGFACYADLVMPSKVMGSRKAVLDLLDRVEALPRPMERRIFVNSGPVSLEQVLRGLAGLADLISSLPCKPIQPADLSKACLSDGVLVGGEEAGVWAKQTKAWELGKRGRVLLDLEARPNKLQQPATFMLRFAVRNTKSSARNDCALVAAVSNPASLTRHEIDSLFHEVRGWRKVAFYSKSRKVGTCSCCCLFRHSIPTAGVDSCIARFRRSPFDAD